MVKVKWVASLILVLFVLTSGYQCRAFKTSIPTSSGTASPNLTSTQGPTPTGQSLSHQPERISKQKLYCSLLGTFTKCFDDVLGFEFEYPTTWGDIEAELRTGGYSGYAYTYYFGGKTVAETEPLVAGGRSKDFSEGRGWMPADFAGYGEVGIQSKGSCEPRELYPLCEEVRPHVTWMLRFPNAKGLCEGLSPIMVYPTFRIEIDLPTHPTIHGFVFEAPVFSESFYREVESDLYPLLGFDAEMRPTQCDEHSQQAFDAKLKAFLDQLTGKSADQETLKNLDALLHLANSIRFR